MAYQFPTEEELEFKSIEEIHALYPQSPEEEAVMQKVLNKRILGIPLLDRIKKDDVPDIKTPEDESKWQVILDARQREVDIRFKGEAFLEKEIEDNEKKRVLLESEELEREKMENIAAEVAQEKVEEPVVEMKNESKPIERKVHCSECGSKSPAFHKIGCSKRTKKQ